MKYTLIIIIQMILSLTVKAQTEYLRDKRCIQSPDTLNGTEVLTIVEQPPEYKGGMSNFYKELSKLTTYPKEKQRISIDTKYIYTFVVDTLGNMRGFCLIKPENGSLINRDSLSQLNNWIPGRQNGTKVPVRLIIPVIIELK